jgi:hypothetical protein
MPPPNGGSAAYNFQPAGGYATQSDSYSARPRVIEVSEFEPTAPPLGGWLIFFIISLILGIGVSLLSLKVLSDEMGLPHQGVIGLRSANSMRNWSIWIISLMVYRYRCLLFSAGPNLAKSCGVSQTGFMGFVDYYG